MMREPVNESELENLKKLGKVHPLGALLAAIAYLERAILKFGESVGIANKFGSNMPISGRYLEINGIELPEDLKERLDKTRRLRNMAAHGRAEPTRDDVVTAISTIEELEAFLSKQDIESTKDKVFLARKRREAERPNYDNSRVLMPPDQWMHEVLKNFLMVEPSLGQKKFIIEVKEGKIMLSELPETLPGDARSFEYIFVLNDRGDNISSESERIKLEIIRDCAVGAVPQV